MNKSTIIVEDFNSHLAINDRISRLKTSNNMGDLKTTTTKIELIGTNRTLHPTTIEYMFL